MAWDSRFQRGRGVFHRQRHHVDPVGRDDHPDRPAFLHKGEHVILGHGIWARREVEPACQIADLPPIDLIVLSHYHGDHFDDVAAQELEQKLRSCRRDAVGQAQPPRLPAGPSPRHLGITPGAQGRGHPDHHRNAGQARHRRGGQRATHAGQRALAGLQPDGQQLYRLYITGDTMLVDSLEDIPRRYPDIDLGLIHTGGTTFLVTVVTMTGEQGVRAVEITKPRTAIPIHYNDFRSSCPDSTTSRRPPRPRARRRSSSTSPTARPTDSSHGDRHTSAEAGQARWTSPHWSSGDRSESSGGAKGFGWTGFRSRTTLTRTSLGAYTYLRANPTVAGCDPSKGVGIFRTMQTTAQKRSRNCDNHLFSRRACLKMPAFSRLRLSANRECPLHRRRL